MKTISAYCITQNQANIVGYALHNPLLECNEIIVIDGISDDNTEEVIWNKAKELKMEHKVKYFKNRFVTLNDQRNFAIQKIQTDHVMYVDSDEIFTRNHLQKIKNYIEQYKLILIHSIHYYIDFFHYANDEESTDWYRSYMMPRVFVNEPGLKYLDWSPGIGDHTLMVNGEYFFTYWANNMIHCDKNDVVCHHVGHAMTAPVELNRIKFQLRTDGQIKDEKEVDERARASCYFDERIWNHGQNADKVGIKKTEVPLPDILKGHPLYNVRVIND